MALKLKEFDFKQFLLEKGERVGLYAAGGIAFLIIVLSLFLPGRGILSPSPKKSAEEIKGAAQQKKTLVASAAPSDTEKKQLREVDPTLLKQASTLAQDPEQFRLYGAMF